MIPIYKPYLNGNERKYVDDCLDLTWISSKGKYIERFEKAFTEYTSAEHSTSVCNGTVALHLGLVVAGITAGDEVIVPTLTYVASVNTILQAGATPVFVDSLKSSWQVNPQEIRRKITSLTKAIMVVHLYGQSCDMDEIVKICNEYQLILIEDCAEAIGSSYKRQHVGTFGDIGTFSFFGNKTITTGEGGMVISKNKEIIEKARQIKNQSVSKTKEYWHDMLGYNYRMTNIMAAIGLAQLENVDDILTKKRAIAMAYREKTAHLPLKMHDESVDTTHSFWMCSAILDDASMREPLRQHLKEKDIETRPLFYPAHTLPHLKTNEEFPVADFLSQRGFNIPSFPSLTSDEITYIIDALDQFFTKM